MIEALFKQASTLARLQSGPLAQQLPILAEALREEQYPPETIRRYVRVAEKLGRWLCKHGLSISEADETTLIRYRSSTGRRKDGQFHAAGRGLKLKKVFRLLRMQFAGTEPVCAIQTEGDALVADFDSHLQHVAGLMPGTRSQYLRHARLFLKAVFSAAPFDIAKVTPEAITDFVRVQAGKLKPSFCAAPATSMRVFLRFLVAYRGLPAGVVGAVPTIRQWKSLPKHLSVEEVEQTLATCDTELPVGKRDHAVLLLLVRLALRAGEVARLRLSDIDWREGEVRIHPPKSARERKLPLPSDVGRALAEYVQNGRPKSAQPFLFLRTRAPFSPITGPSTVSGIAKRHLKLAGISTRGLSAHAFRHTAATRMVRSGVGFKQVADVLGHRLLETTNIYAKLDEDTLHRVALPWPGGQA